MKRLKGLLLGGALTAALAVPLLAPAPAQAWWAHPGYGWHGGWAGWHGGWGWRGGWGWHGGVVVGAPVAVVPPVAYPAPYRFIPGHYTPYGAWVPPHWGYY